jgi:ATP-dependent DNA ligase
MTNTLMMGIQKAKHLFLEMDKKKPEIDTPYMMFEKHDGWFGFLDFPSCIIHSRQLREIPALKELSDSIRTHRPDVKGRLIFEIMIEGMEIDSFHTLNGILNRKYEQAEDVYLQVHDFIPDFQFCTMSAHHRYQFAKEIVQRLGHPQVRLSPILGVSQDPKRWNETAELIQARGGEGLILKARNALYTQGKRISTLMKIKEEVTVEMLVTKVIEGQGDHEGMAGKLVCKDEVGQLHEIGMGCATHKERTLWLVTPSEIVGSVVEIKAMKVLTNGKYREPRFKAQRFDKGVHELG